MADGKGGRKMKVVAIIPARYGSNRLPGKPLAEIGGKPMIVRVYERAVDILAMERVIVATDDERIAARIHAIGGECFLTHPDHPSGTDRVAEVARRIGLSSQDLVVNIQGDQPLLDPGPVTSIIDLLRSRKDLAMATAACPLSIREATNPNRVKVVLDISGNALYFSRAPIPFDRDGVSNGTSTNHGTSPYLRHLGIYAFRQGFLQKFVDLPPSRLEQLEQLEQLRALENGYTIGVAVVDQAPVEVDTTEDLDMVRRIVSASRAHEDPRH